MVDDVNMPIVETYGAQPPVELLRQFLDFSGFYDREKLFWKDIEDALLFVGAAPPGGGRAVVTPRFTRHFNVLCMPPASDAVMYTIFESILKGFLSKKFDDEAKGMCQGVVKATIDLYNRISAELLPTPAKFHYTFNLRDISKVFQGKLLHAATLPPPPHAAPLIPTPLSSFPGVLMITAGRCKGATTFTRLWAHECSRVFADRLINKADNEWFEAAVAELVTRQLKQSATREDLFEKPIVFCDFLKVGAEVKFYEESKDVNKLEGLLVEYVASRLLLLLLRLCPPRFTTTTTTTVLLLYYH